MITAASAPSGTSNFAFGAIVIAFIIYIVAKGELSTYLQFFVYQPPAGSTVAPPAAPVAPPNSGGYLINPGIGNPGLFVNPFTGIDQPAATYNPVLTN